MVLLLATSAAGRAGSMLPLPIAPLPAAIRAVMVLLLAVGGNAGKVGTVGKVGTEARKLTPAYFMKSIGFK